MHRPVAAALFLCLLGSFTCTQAQSWHTSPYAALHAGAAQEGTSSIPSGLFAGLRGARGTDTPIRLAVDLRVGAWLGSDVIGPAGHALFGAVWGRSSALVNARTLIGGGTIPDDNVRDAVAGVGHVGVTLRIPGTAARVGPYAEVMRRAGTWKPVMGGATVALSF